MGTMLGFPLAMPLGGVAVTGVRAEAQGENLWLLTWVPNAQPNPAAFMIYVDGKLWGSVAGATEVYIRGESDASPIVEIAQLPIEWSDPGFARNGYFSSIVANKIQVTWDPPADVTDVDAYRVYWDNGTGTVDFTSIGRLGDIPEDGSTAYEFWTIELANGTYKFVVRTVDSVGNESTNVATLTVVHTNYPGLVTNESHSVIAGPGVTITWTDPSDIGSGNVRVYTNGGSTTNLLPDYDTILATIAAGTQTFTSAVLGDGIHVFGLRVYNGTNEELNTYVWLIVRLESGAAVSAFSGVPNLTSELQASGKVLLMARVNPRNPSGTKPVKVRFFTNDGAGGSVDYATPLEGAGQFTNLQRLGPGWFAEFVSITYGETARKFGCRAYTTAGIASVNATEITVTPDATVPPLPLNLAAVAGRS